MQMRSATQMRTFNYVNALFIFDFMIYESFTKIYFPKYLLARHLKRMHRPDKTNKAKKT